jgi:hypothetical protein
MNQEQARNFVRQTLTQSFDKTRFRNFVLELLNKFDESKAFTSNKTYIKDAFKEHVERFERLGTYTSPDDDKLDVLVVHLTKQSKLERARTVIRNFVADHLKQRDGKDAALVAFVSPTEKQWRFSYVKMEYATVENDSGKVGVQTRLTPARRFSYIVGEGESCHTAQTRFLDLLQDTDENPALAQVEEAFSVEAVTKEFFKKYAELFGEIQKALEKLIAKDKTIASEFEKKGVRTADFAKKLMGQIVFLYFIQKKGWLGVEKAKDWGTGPHDFLRRLANSEYGSYESFFNDILEPLFYDTLATDRGHDAWCKRFNCRIPFLNGGLFEPLGDYDWRKTDIVLPNRLFTNTERFDDFSTGTGLLDMFDRYNFTVNEAEPLEKEVAIDPEMLGKVFENLIEENLRKGLGSYYTPREIVHYMCQESLINYLDTALNSATETIGREKRKQAEFGDEKSEQTLLAAPARNEILPRADIETFVHLGDQISHYEAVETRYAIKMPKSIEKSARLIDEKLADITICDPAVGSGAFPVGMMTEIVRARSALTPYFNDVRDRMPYHFKRHAIHNCLYGVDIDPGAVEIAKLRLWLSLVVDEEDVKQIKPLPNLFYKIVAGNSLFGVEQTLFNENLFRKLEELKPRYFDEPDKDKKDEYKRRIENTIQELTNGKEIFDFRVYFSEVFHKTCGFDVVIGNPPYLRIQNIEKNEAQRLKQIYTSAVGKFDIYVLFVEKAFDLIKPSGVIIFIHPHRFLTADYGRGLKTFLDGTKGLQSAIFFGVNQIFETATTYTGVFAYSRNNSSFGFKHATARNFRDGTFKSSPYNPGGKHWIVSTETGSSSDLVQKICASGRKMSDVFEGIFQGIVTVGDDIFVLRGEVAGRYFNGFSCALNERVRLESGIVRPLLKGENIRRYTEPTSDLFIFYPHYEDGDGKTHPFSESELRREFPLGFDYIRHFKSALVKKKISYKTNPTFWFSLHRSREISIFEGTKILTPQLQNFPNFTLDDRKWYPDAGGYSLVKRTSVADADKFLLGVMNSAVLWYFIKSTSNPYAHSYYYFKTKYLERFSIPVPTKPVHDRIVALVDRILATKQRDADANTSASEREIDELVYALYGLTPEEIKIVEGASPASKAS